MPIDLKLTDGFYQDDSLPLANQQCVNFYIDVPQTNDALSRRALVPVPGIRMVSDTQTRSDTYKGCRGMHMMNDKLYAFFSSGMYYIDDNYNRYLKSDAVSLAGSKKTPLSIADNGTYMCIVGRGDTSYPGLIYTESGGIAYITDTNFTANGYPQATVFWNGYFIFTTDTNKIIVSDINDPTSYNALAFGSAEADPDKIYAPTKINNKIYIVGRYTIEEMDYIDATFPLQRTGTFFEIGARCPYTIVSRGDIFYFVGSKKKSTLGIYACNGITCDKISTTAIDRYISNIGTTFLDETDANAFTYRGIDFIVFNFIETSFVYNATNGTWTEFRSYWYSFYDQENLSGYTRWRVKAIEMAYGKVFVGDIEDDRIGVLDHTVYQEYEDADNSLDTDIIKRWFTTSVIQNDGDPIDIDYLELFAQSGQDGSTIGMSYSRDGLSFSQPLERSIGEIGERNKRQIWRPIPYFEKMCLFRFEASGNFNPYIYGVKIG